MKKIKLIFFGLIIIFTLNSCDKIENPYIKKAVITLDTNLYPGNWSNYIANEIPKFDENTYAFRNILLEDYTGHQCPGCPKGAEKAEEILNSNPSRVYVAAIHTSPGGPGSFQATNSIFTHDFTNPASNEYGKFFGINNGSVYGFIANPYGTVNRFPYGPNNNASQMFDFWTSWTQRVNDMISENNHRINIQAKSNYYEETKGGYIHTEIDFEKNVNGNFKLVTYVIQKSIIAKQKSGSETINDYNHKHVLLGTIDKNPWGVKVANGLINAGSKFKIDYSYKIPENLSKDKLQFLIYIYDDNSKEIYQVIEHKF